MEPNCGRWRTLATLVVLQLTLFGTFQFADALNCYICAESGLEEFGECRTSFPFNCDAYAKRFAANEKIFCRTTRHKTVNESYTVVKECIAESAHYATFPRKSYQMEEECDVVDLNGFEVAYCLCRDAHLCNSAPIVDQFSAFEEKYPELFDPEQQSASAERAKSTQQLADEDQRSVALGGDEEELAAGAAGEQQQQQQQSEEESQRGSEVEGETAPLFTTNAVHSTHRPQSGGRIAGNEREPQWPRGTLQSAGDVQFGGLIPTSTTEQNPFVAPPGQDQFLRTSGGGGAIPVSDENAEEANGRGQKTNVGAFVTQTTAPTATRSELGAQFGTGSELGTLPELRCIQCSETELPDAGADCRTQVVVSCPDQSRQVPGIGRPLCLSRQIMNPKVNQFAVEKMCATERDVLNEFSGAAVPMLNGAINDEIGCHQSQATADGTVQRVCICSSAQCNKPNMNEQISFAKPSPAQQPPSAPTATLTSKAVTSTYSQPSTTTTKAGQEGGTEGLSGRQSSSPRVASDQLNCAVCLDVSLKSAQADCGNANTQNCAHQIRDEKAFCLTRQTQNGKDGFIVEKSCVSRKQFYQQFPEELHNHARDQIALGCASTYDGYVNYCICDGHMCNGNSIVEQAESLGSSRNGNTNENKSPKSAATSGEQKEGRATTPNWESVGGSAERRKPSTQGTTKSGAGPPKQPRWDESEEQPTSGGGESATVVTRKRPDPSGIGANASPSTPSTPRQSAASGLTSSASFPSTAAPPRNSTSDATRERLEKWKENSQPKHPQRHNDATAEEYEDASGGTAQIEGATTLIGLLTVLASTVLLFN